MLQRCPFIIKHAPVRGTTRGSDFKKDMVQRSRLEEGGTGFDAGGMDRKLRVFTCHHRSATGPGGKGKLERPGRVVNSVAGFLTVRIDVSKPADALRRHGFEILAVGIEELIITLFFADAGNGRFALGFYVRNPNIGRWPAVLRSDKRSSTLNFVQGGGQRDGRQMSVPRQDTSSFPHRDR